MSDTTSDDEFVVEIDLGEMDWPTPALWEDSPTRAPAPRPEPDFEPNATPAPRPPAPPAPPAPAPPAPQAVTHPAPAPAAGPAHAGPAHDLPPAFAEIVSGNVPGNLRELAGSTFARLLKTLDTLAVIERALTQPRAVRVGLLFGEVREQAAALLSHVTEAVSGGAPLPGRVRDVLDGMRFIIGHELTKVFRQEFPGLNDETRSYSRADLSRAWGLLHNCLQQTAITLAQAFSPRITGEQLFEDYKTKVENSFTLYRELHALLQKVSTAEGSSGILLKHTLVRHLEHFRDETMHFLMYKDWGEFGRYVDDVKRAFEEMEEFEAVLHEFSQYLSTLIHHVGMREALRGVQVHTPEPGRE
ncbi:MAG TPA: hypothetical protein VF621_07845 [Pyrinomonadaceae bacterium]